MKIELNNFLIISLVLLGTISCTEKKDLRSYYLDGIKCDYKFMHSDDTLFLYYKLVFDTTTFELAKIDERRSTIFKSAYFDYNINYISYKVLNEQQIYNNIVVYFFSDSFYKKPISMTMNRRTDLFEKYENKNHLIFMTYLIDSIPIGEYFTFNKILNDLYKAYGDSRLTWNYAYLISRFEKCQCNNENVDVSFEILRLIDIGIKLSSLDKNYKKSMLEHNGFFIRECIHDIREMRPGFEQLHLNFSER